MVLKTEPGIEPFFLISGSISVFYRFLAGFPVVDRLLTGFGAFNRTGLALGSQLNRMDRPVRPVKREPGASPVRLKAPKPVNNQSTTEKPVKNRSKTGVESEIIKKTI